MVNPKKCHTGKHELDFLGHRINQHGVSPRPGKVEAIKDFPKLTNVKGLSEFLGMVNLYRRFMPNAAQTMGPLFAATSGNPRPNDPLERTDDLSSAFTDTKQLLINTTALN